MSAPLYGIVLAGGRSSRMGQDKASLTYHGRPQLHVAFDLLSDFVERAFVSVRPGQDDDPVRGALPQITDQMESVGPAAGLLAAHAAHPQAAWIALACDLPQLDRATLEALVAARTGTHDAYTFDSTFDGKPEPLCAIWEPAALEVLARQVAEEGKICPRRALMSGHTQRLPPRSSGALDNINTPQEREAALARLESSCRA